MHVYSVESLLKTLIFPFLYQDYFREIGQRNVSLSHPVMICWGSVVYLKISCYLVIHGSSFILEMTYSFHWA